MAESTIDYCHNIISKFTTQKMRFVTTALISQFSSINFGCSRFRHQPSFGEQLQFDLIFSSIHFWQFWFCHPLFGINLDLRQAPIFGANHDQHRQTGEIGFLNVSCPAIWCLSREGGGDNSYGSSHNNLFRPCSLPTRAHHS